jgi:hypothetical protein
LINYIEGILLPVPEQLKPHIPSSFQPVKSANMSSLQGCIIGFGDPVLDIIAPSITDEFLHQHNMQSGGCIAIEEAQLDELLTRLHNNTPTTTPPQSPWWQRSQRLQRHSRYFNNIVALSQ